MFEGIYNNAYNSVADFGASRTLGIRGSLMGYIQTGNAYDKDYYSPQSGNAVVSSHEKVKSRNAFDKFITFVSIAGIAAGIFALVKTGKAKEILPFIKSFSTKAKENLSDSLSKLKNKSKNADNTSKFSDYLNNLKKKFTKNSTDETPKKNFFSRFKKKSGDTPPPAPPAAPGSGADNTYVVEVLNEAGNVIASGSAREI